MQLRKFAALAAVFLLVSGVLASQGPRKDVGTKVPLPPSSNNSAGRVSGPQTGEGPPTSLSIDVDLVSLDAVVTEKSGNPIAGLVKGDFKVFDDNVEQTISNFSPTDAPLTVVVLVEFGRTIGYYYDNVVGSAAGFINSLRENDWGALVAYDLRPEILTDFTKNKGQLFAGLARLRQAAYSEVVLYDAVIDTLDRLENIDGKKVIFLLSTGQDTISKHTQSEMIKKAQTSDTMIYPVSLGQMARLVYQGSTSALDEITMLQWDNNLKSLAEASGGSAFFPRFPTEYPGIYESVGNQLRNQYSMGFVPTNQTKDGKLHKLRVEVRDMDVNHDGKIDKLTVRHKKGYYAPRS